jgi:hypothetical protein
MAKGNKNAFLTMVGQAVNTPSGEADSLKKNLFVPETETDIQKHKRMKLALPEEQEVAVKASPSEPLPQQNSKKGVEKKSTRSLGETIMVGGIAITSDTLNEIAQKTLEINATMCNVRIHPRQDFKLNMLAQKLRYEHNLNAKSGINKTTLIYLILEKALKEVEV